MRRGKFYCVTDEVGQHLSDLISVGPDEYGRLRSGTSSSIGFSAAIGLESPPPHGLTSERDTRAA